MRTRRAMLAAAVSVGLLTTMVGLASADEPTAPPSMGRMHAKHVSSDPSMARMHAEMVGQDPSMARMHANMVSGHTGSSE